MVLDLLNFRDLGGMAAGQGAIRPGALFRSEGPANFTEAQQEVLGSLGIRNIIDLRSAPEQAAAPHAWHGPDCYWRGLHVDADLRVFGHEGRDRLIKGSDPQIAVDTMVETYREIPSALLPHWAEIAECLGDSELPVLINCTAGKDRTGVVVALILEMAGVPRNAILKDYLSSEIFGRNIQASGKLEAGLMASFGFLPSQGQIDALIGVRPEYLVAAWEAIEQGWSSIPNYLAEAGVSIPAQQEIAKVLVGQGAHNHSTGEYA